MYVLCGVLANSTQSLFTVVGCIYPVAMHLNYIPNSVTAVPMHVGTLMPVDTDTLCRMYGLVRMVRNGIRSLESKYGGVIMHIYIYYYYYYYYCSVHSYCLYRMYIIIYSVYVYKRFY